VANEPLPTAIGDGSVPAEPPPPIVVVPARPCRPTFDAAFNDS
jgi:hypothetical protein